MESSRGNRAPVLVQAAEELFFEKGYAGATMEQVSRRAGFSKRTVYLYFKNKDELFLEVASRGLTILQTALEAVPVDELPFQEAVETIMERYIQFACDEPHYFRMIFHDATAEMMANAGEAIRRRVAAQERGCLRVPAQVVQRGIDAGLVPPVDPTEAAVVFWGTATGIIMLSMGGSQTVLPDNRLDIIRRGVWVLYHGFMNLPAQTWEAAATNERA